MNNRGFTLTEILMVILLVGIMSAVAIPQFVDFSSEARTAKTQQRLKELKLAITGDASLISNGQYVKPGFEAHLGDLPNSLDDLVIQGSQPNYDPFSKRGWRGPYVNNTASDWNVDGWGNLIQYTKASRELRSCGDDGTCGNGDDILVQF